MRMEQQIPEFVAWFCTTLPEIGDGRAAPLAVPQPPSTDVEAEAPTPPRFPERSGLASEVEGSRLP